MLGRMGRELAAKLVEEVRAAKMENSRSIQQQQQRRYDDTLWKGGNSSVTERWFQGSFVTYNNVGSIVDPI